MLKKDGAGGISTKGSILEKIRKANADEKLFWKIVGVVLFGAIVVAGVFLFYLGR
jgi:hypothetical protein